MDTTVSSGKVKHIRWGELLAIIIPIVLYIGGLSIAGFRTIIQHGDAIIQSQTDIKDIKESQRTLQIKIDDKFDKIQADLTEIKLMLKDKQDRK